MATNKKHGRSKNHTGHTYELNGRYRTVIRYKGRTVTAMGDTKTESNRAAQQKLKALPEAIHLLDADAAKIKLNEFLPAWLENKHKNKVAYTTYKRYVGLMNKWILPSLGRMKLQEINKKHINRLMDSMEGKVGPRSRQQARALLSATFAAALRIDYVLENPVLKSDEVEYKKNEVNPLKLTEVLAILNYSLGTSANPRWRLACFYGLRQGEALGLRWSNIDFENKTIKICEKMQTIDGIRVHVPLKSKSSNRALELDDATIESLKIHRKLQAERRLALGPDWVDMDLVFPAANGKPLNPKVDFNNWRAILKECGIPQHRLHDARHTAATILYDNGMEIELIRRFLGNASVELTSGTYVHHSSRQLRGAADLIQGMSQPGIMAI
jgi:integrase